MAPKIRGAAPPTKRYKSDLAVKSPQRKVSKGEPNVSIQKLQKGDVVEVRLEEHGLHGSWHPAVICGLKPGLRQVEFKNLFDSKDNPVKEWVRFGRPAAGAKQPLGIRKESDCKPFLRLGGPGMPPAESSFRKTGGWPKDLWVEVYSEEAWWEGVFVDDISASHMDEEESVVDVIFPQVENLIEQVALSGDAHDESIMEPCSIQMANSADDIDACRFDPCVGLSSADDQSLSMKPSFENCVETLVDATGECIEWDPIDIKASRDRRASDHDQCEADVLASDDADLFLAVEQSKSLECNDEGSNEEVVVEEGDEFEDIDPYLFIKRLPSLSEVVAPCRPLLLPRQTRRSPPITLVLDLDETLVHSTLELCADADFSFPVHFDFQEHMVYVRRRPHLQMFMERVAQLFEIIVFTASQSIYAEQLLNVLDPKRKLIRHRIFRDSCVFVRGNYLKDLTILGRDLSKVAIIDNSPQAYGFQVDNGIPIESWFDDRSDSALAGLLPFLETLVGVDDVRPIIAKRFNLRGKIAAAAELPY